MITHPNPGPNMSQQIENGFSISSITNIGVIVNHLFNYWKPASQAGIHLNFLSFSSSSVLGLLIFQESFDKPPIITSQSKKTLNIANTRIRTLAQHILNLTWINRYSSLRDDMTCEGNLLQPKLTLAHLGI
jgi:hypothetical protein